MEVVFITGGTNGIGAATVKRFIQDDCKVAFLDCDKERGLQLESQYRSDQALFLHGDVARIKDIENAVKNTIRHFGNLTAVVANAGVFLHKTLLETTEDEWDHLMSVNLKGAVFTVRAALPYLIKNGGGAIVMLGSDQCFIGKKNCPAYGASKGAIGQITRNLALDYADSGIRVNAVCPGATKTSMLENIVKTWADQSFDGDCKKVWSIIINEHPLKRLCIPEEVANVIRFLISEEASFITGSLFSIDGGLTAA